MTGKTDGGLPVVCPLDVLEMAAVAETCLPFLPPTGQRNIGLCVRDLRRLATDYAALLAEHEALMARVEKDHRVALAAYDWWLTKRPARWSEAAQMESPSVNCVGNIERHLAEMVAVSRLRLRSDR